MDQQAHQNNIGRYVIESKLGQGGMAEVYAAYDPMFKRRVAIKVLPAYLLQMDPTFASRFTREAETIASLEHSAIVPVYDFGEADGRPYLVMRLMTGGSLEDRILKGPISLEETAELFTHLAPAIDKAHSKGIIHRDLKPGNILFDDEGFPFLADFGIVRLQDATSTLTQSGIIGTPAYMSPEQAKGRKDLDGRSDIYSLGAILFQMLTGRLPYESDTPHGFMMCHITDPIPEIREFLPDASEALQEIISKAMAKGKEERYHSARAFAEALQEMCFEQPSEPILINKSPKIETYTESTNNDQTGALDTDYGLSRDETTLYEDVGSNEIQTAVQPSIKIPIGKQKEWIKYIGGVGITLVALVIVYFIGYLGQPRPVDIPTHTVGVALIANPTETAAPTNTISRGEQTARSVGCLACHGDVVSVGPTFNSLFQSEVLLDDESIVTADEAYIIESILEPQAKVVAEYQNLMPRLADNLTEEEIKDLVSYIQSFK